MLKAPAIRLGFAYWAIKGTRLHKRSAVAPTENQHHDSPSKRSGAQDGTKSFSWDFRVPEKGRIEGKTIPMLAI
jgi:hypothetical protein